MFWIHILKEDVRLWHPFTTRDNINKYMESVRRCFKRYIVKEGPIVLPGWVLEARYFERGPREWFEVRDHCMPAKELLLKIARRLEDSDFWYAGWMCRKASFLFERRVGNGTVA